MLALGSKAIKSLSILILIGGCASSKPSIKQPDSFVDRGEPAVITLSSDELVASATTPIQTVGYLDEGIEVGQFDLQVPDMAHTTLASLERMAEQRNPRLLRLSQEYQAASSKSQYVDKLPDPRFGANVFGNALETAAGSQRANMTFSQAIPWLGRLRADEQRAIFEAYAVHAELKAEELRVLAAVRTGWYRLYVLEKQIEIAEGNQQLLQSLIDVANARIATGTATQGDVLLGTVELSQLEERLLSYRRQQTGVEAELNRLVARDADTPIASPQQLSPEFPRFSWEELNYMTQHGQPEIEAARMRSQATRWGVEVARLMRRPEFMLSASYFPTDNNRPPSSVVDVGQDPWNMGAQVSLPIWRQKYDAMENEAKWKHQAAHSSVEELSDRYESMILDLLAEARRAHETAELYESTILPQARQTLTTDQDSYANGAVEFDRVIRDYRSLLTLEMGYHQAIGDLATAIAKLCQVSGSDAPLAAIRVQE